MIQTLPPVRSNRFYTECSDGIPPEAQPFWDGKKLVPLNWDLYPNIATIKKVQIVIDKNRIYTRSSPEQKDYLQCFESIVRLTTPQDEVYEIGLHLFPVYRLEKQVLLPLEILIKEKDEEKVAYLPLDVSEKLLSYLVHGKPSLETTCVQFINFIYGLSESNRNSNHWEQRSTAKPGDVVYLADSNKKYKHALLHLKEDVSISQYGRTCLRASTISQMVLSCKSTYLQVLYRQDLMVGVLTTLLNQVNGSKKMLTAFADNNFNLLFRQAAQLPEYVPLFQFLIEHRKKLGIDFSSRGEFSGTALDVAIKSKNETAKNLIEIELLKENNEKNLLLRDLHILLKSLPVTEKMSLAYNENNFNLLFRQAAQRPEYFPLLQFLVEHLKKLEIDFSSRGDSSGTALDIAVKSGNQKAKKLLELQLFKEPTPNRQSLFNKLKNLLSLFPETEKMQAAFQENNFNLLFRQAAQKPEYFQILNLLAEYIPQLQIHIYAKGKTSGTALDVATSNKNEPARKLLLSLIPNYPFANIKGLEFLQTTKVNHADIKNYANALPGEKTFEILERFISENGLEMESVGFIDYGAGTALWSRFFLENGFKTLAVDCQSIRQLYFPDHPSFLDTTDQKIVYVEANESALPQDCSKEVLFLCWPEDPQNTNYEPYAQRILKEFRAKGGSLAIYVGQPRGGITAADGFFDELEENWNVTLLDRSSRAIQSRSSAETFLKLGKKPMIDNMYLITKKSNT